MLTYSILALCLSLGYVTAQDSDCVSLSEVRVDIKVDIEGFSLVLLNQPFTRLPNFKNGYPVYEYTRPSSIVFPGGATYNISVTDNSGEDVITGFSCSDCQTTFTFGPPNGTCFTNDAYGTYTLTLPGETGAIGNITLESATQIETLAPAPQTSTLAPAPQTSTLAPATQTSTLGYVTAQDPDPCPVSVPEVHVSFPESVNASDGIYKRLPKQDNQNGYPVYALGQNNFAVFDMLGGINAYVIFTCGTCGMGGGPYSVNPSTLTCFQNGKFNYTLYGADGNITLQAPPPSLVSVLVPATQTSTLVPATQTSTLCPVCKQVLDGPLQNLYELVSENEPRCKDGCLYSNPEGREFCFEAGPDQVLLECPPGPGPIQTTIQN